MAKQSLLGKFLVTIDKISKGTDSERELDKINYKNHTQGSSLKTDPHQNYACIIDITH